MTEETQDIAAGAAGGVDNATVVVEENPNGSGPPDDQASKVAAERRQADLRALEQNVVNADKKIAKLQASLDDAVAGKATAEAELAAFDKEAPAEQEGA